MVLQCMTMAISRLIISLPKAPFKSPLDLLSRRFTHRLTITSRRIHVSVSHRVCFTFLILFSQALKLLQTCPSCCAWFNLKRVGDSFRGGKPSLFNILKPRVVDTLQYCTLAVFKPLERKNKNRV